MNRELKEEIITDYGVLVTLVGRLVSHPTNSQCLNAVSDHINNVSIPLLIKMRKDKAPETIEERFAALEKRLQQLEGSWY